MKQRRKWIRIVSCIGLLIVSLIGYMLLELNLFHYQKVLKTSRFIEENERYVTVINEEKGQYTGYVFEKKQFMNFTFYPELLSMETDKASLKNDLYQTVLLNENDQTHVFVLGENEHDDEKIKVSYHQNGQSWTETVPITDDYYLKHFVYDFDFDVFPTIEYVKN